MSQCAFLLLFVIFPLFCMPLTAQSFFDWYQKGDSLLRAQEPEAALSAYQNAFSIREGTHPMFYLNPAAAAAQSGNAEQAMAYLETAVAKGLDETKWLESNESFEQLRATERWKKLFKAINRKKSKKDDALARRLEQLYVKDQMIRRLSQCADSVLLGEEGRAAFEALARLQDSLNQAVVIQLIKQHGWLGQSRVGRKGNEALWLIIQHAPLDMQQQYFPSLQESVAEGESPAWHAAMLEDRILVRTGQKQKYGTQVRTSPETGKPELHPIKDIEGLDARRREVGLEPLEDYLKKMGMKPEEVGRGE